MGTLRTIEYMRAAVREGIVDPLTDRTVSHILSGVLYRTPSTQVAAIRGWVEQHSLFQRDPHGAELIRRVREQLTDIATRGAVQGDCDDAAVLAAALGKAAGFPARFVTLGFFRPGDHYRHIYAELWDGMGWREMDVFRPAMSAEPKRLMITKV